jgi:hypothetical protein
MQLRLLLFTWALAIAASAQTPPTADYATPFSPPASPAQTFTFQGSSALGAANIDSLSLWFGWSPSSVANACYVQYSNTNQTFSILNDAGSAWTAAANGTMSNSQCTVTQMTAQISGNSVIVIANVAIAGGSQGQKNIYMSVTDVSGLTSGVQTVGTWSAQTSAVPVPLADSQADFSGTQGQNNWQYGLYPNGDPTQFTTAPLIFVPALGVWQHTGSAPPPWTRLGPWFAHPNEYGGVTEYAVRRWTSSYTGHVQVTVHLSKADTTCGDGTMGLLYLNSAQIATLSVDYNDAIGKTAVVPLDLNANDRLDLALSAGPSHNDGCDTSLFTAIVMPAPSSTLITDSSRDFSSIQGANGWTYGYFPASGGFTQLPFDPTAGAWRHVPFNPPPWTTIWGAGQHPNGVIGASLEQADRRWTSTYTGHVQVVMHAAKADTTCGDGTTAIFNLNGVPQGQIPLAFNDAVGQTLQYFLDIRVGDLLDFELSPAGLGVAPGAANNNCDSTTFTATISQAPTFGTTLTDTRYFSTFQGVGGWYYSYRSSIAGTLADIQNNIAGPNSLQWDGVSWHHPGIAEGAYPYTTIEALYTHPNASPNEDPVRRWVSNTAGPVTVQWHIAKANSGCGDGVWAYVYINGVQQQSLHIADTDYVGLGSQFNAVLGIGDPVDFILSAGPPPETASNTCSDATNFYGTIFTRAPGAPILLSAVGLEQTIQVPYSDIASGGALAQAEVKINAAGGAVKCWAEYDATQGMFFLQNAAGSGWMSAGLSPGATGSVSNGVCTLKGAGSAVSGSGNNLTATFDLVFGSADSQAILSRRVDYSGGSQGGWVSAGLWPVIGPLTIRTNTLPGGTAGSPYSAAIGVAGGSTPYSWALTSAAPTPGLTLSTRTGAISGTPLSAGASSFAITVTDAAGAKASQQLTISVLSPPLTINTTTLPGGTTSAAYLQTVLASGGTPPYCWAKISGSLPSGLNLIPGSGAISGVAAVAGTFNFVVAVTDSSPTHQAVTQSLSIGISQGPLTIQTTPAAAGSSVAMGKSFSQPLIASGGTPPYTWSIASGSLPVGLSLAPATGVIGGTPTVTGTSSFTARAVDSAGASATQSLSITIPAALVITTPSLTIPVRQNGPAYPTYSLGLTATGGTAPYYWGISSGSLPSGLTLDFSTGVLFGTLTPSGNYSFTVQAADSAPVPQTATRTYTLSIAARPFSVLNQSAATGTVGIPFSEAFSAADGVAPYAWSISGSLPAGLTLNGATGTITGTPTVAGSFTFQISARDSSGAPQTASLSAEIDVDHPPHALSLYAPILPIGEVGAVYSQRLIASGGTPPYAWSWNATSCCTIPAGLALDGVAGIISGTPTAAGTNFVFNVTVKDSSPLPQIATAGFAMTILPASSTLTITTASLPPSAVGVPYLQTLAAIGGTPPYTWSWAPITGGALPAGFSLDSATGTITGTAANITAAFSYVGFFNATVTDSSGSTATRNNLNVFVVPQCSMREFIRTPNGLIVENLTCTQ